MTPDVNVLVAASRMTILTTKQPMRGWMGLLQVVRMVQP